MVKPQWVSNDPRDTIAGPPGTLPELGNAGRPEAVEGKVLLSKVTSEDWPFSHNSHDWIWYMAIDAPYYHRMVSNGNEKIVDLVRDHRYTDRPRAMEMEWETAYFPMTYFPTKGDRAWMMGRHVFDCGHRPYRTEIHPPKAVAFTRAEPRITVGRDQAPSLTNVTRFWAHGRGGYYNAPVANRDYEFDIPLPPRPSPTARPIAFTPHREGTMAGRGRPVLTPTPADNPTRVHVRIPMNAGRTAPSHTYGATIVTGWRETQLTRGYRKLRVTFDSIRVLRDHDPIASGEWELYLQAGPRWLRPNAASSRALRDVDNGQTVQLPNMTAEFFVPDNGSLHLQSSGWESDWIDGKFGVKRDPAKVSGSLLDNNDVIGLFARTFTARDAFGVGSTHVTRSTSNDFEVRYRIQEVARYPAGARVTDPGKTPPPPPSPKPPGPPPYKCEQVPRLCLE
ncbi:hypothetical protein CLM62_39995 [Streptomyces sp. SA15]|uniref:hypothetical protein n=1 Tax=Streptomyces sp. SA15 TaxID=934019 RepID=UPI000BB04DBA|nr:hypothetical protein [Streptomyces sp. SA15]PAZ10584.1 hypothetical protein CLM62_39995 [Streptomyces sp. SA15]